MLNNGNKRSVLYKQFVKTKKKVFYKIKCNTKRHVTRL